MGRQHQPGEALVCAVAQFSAGSDMGENVLRIGELVDAAAKQGARLVVFPEASMFAWDATAEELRAAAEWGTEFIERVGEFAERAQMYVIAGVFVEVEVEDARPRNRLVVMGPDGTLRTSYDKVHLFDAFSWRESDKVSPADTHDDFSELCTVDIDGFTVGLLNCYDLRFPEMARALVERGAEVLAVSAAWVAGPLKEMHWDVLLRARAIENTCYVLGASQPPPASAGLSTILDPMGVSAATCVGLEGLALHRLEGAHLRHVRETVPSLVHRRYRITAETTRDAALATRS